MPERDMTLNWAATAAGTDVIDGICYTSVELQHLTNDMRIRSAMRYQGRDEGATLLKVIVYLTRQNGKDTELLVFDHRDHPDAGTQVPAGTIESGESPEAAAIRELAEEAGLTNATLLNRIDVYEWENTTTGRWHRRHVYHFAAPSNVEDRWEHVVTAGEGDRGLTFSYYWLSLRAAEAQLCGDQGRSIRNLPLD